MTLIDTAVAALRSRWATRFVEECAISRRGSLGTMNPATLEYDSRVDVAVYSGACLIRPMSDQAALEAFGEQQVAVAGYLVFLPYDHGATIRYGDTVVKTAPPTTGDVDLVGKELYVEHVEHDAYQTRAKLVCRYNAGGADADTG